MGIILEIVKTATGKRFHSDYAATIDTPPRAYLRIVGCSLSEAAVVFGNPAETIQLWCGDQYFAHYTRLVAIVPESGAIKVILTKE